MWRATIIMAALALALAACSGDDSTAPSGRPIERIDSPTREDGGDGVIESPTPASNSGAEYVDILSDSFVMLAEDVQKIDEDLALDTAIITNPEEAAAALERAIAGYRDAIGVAVRAADGAGAPPSAAADQHERYIDAARRTMSSLDELIVDLQLVDTGGSPNIAGDQLNEIGEQMERIMNAFADVASSAADSILVAG